MPIAAGLKSLGGIVRNNIAKFTRANSKPSGGGSKNSIPSGRNSTKGQRASSGYTPPSFSQRTRGGGSPPWSLQQTPSRGGMQYSPYGNSNPASNPYRRPTTPNGTNFSVNTRGTTALKKGLGGAAMAKAVPAGGTLLPAKATPWGLAALLFLDILGVFDNSGSDGTLPEHLRQPGERQEIEPPEKPPFKSGQGEGVKYRVIVFIDKENGEPSYLTYNVTGAVEGIVYIRDRPWEPHFDYYYVRLLSSSGSVQSGIDGISLRPGTSPPGKNIFRIDSITRLDGQPDTDGDPASNPGIKTSSTTDNSKVVVNNPPPPSIRPPLPSDRTSNPTPSKGFTRPSNKPQVVKQAVTKTPKGGIESNINNNFDTSNDSSINSDNTPEPEQPKIEAPSEIPEPIPVPEPPPEVSIDALKKLGATAGVAPEIGEGLKIIETRESRGADGSKVITRVREATPEEMRDYQRNLKKAREKVQEHRDFLDLSTIGDALKEASEEIRQKIFGDPMTEEMKYPFGKPDWKKMKPSTTPKPEVDTNVSSSPTPVTKPTVKPVPEPDATPEPTPTPEPVVQNKVSDDPIVDKINKLPSKQDIAIAVGGLDIIRQIAEKAGSAIPVCLAPTLRSPIAANHAAIGASQVAVLGQGQVTQSAVRAANSTLNNPQFGLSAIVNNSTYGLAKIQSFAKTAWKAAQGDKIMSGVTMALTIHNAMMLSNNLASTVSEAVNMSFNALGIRNEEDKEIDIGGAIRTKINEVLSSVLGAENYAALTARIAKANRIYQASINLLDTTYSLFDSARTVAELTAENTGKIGNALRESCAVYEDAYEEMTEKINPQNTAMRKLGSFRDKIEVAVDAFDSVTEISSGIVEIKETVGQIETEKQELKTEIDGFIKEQKDEKDAAKIQNQVTTEIADNDFDRDTKEN